MWVGVCVVVHVLLCVCVVLCVHVLFCVCVCVLLCACCFVCCARVQVTYGYTAAGFSGRMPCAEIADAIVFLGSGRASFITGQIIDVNGGKSAS